jgi:hypothetical protein
VIPFSLALSLYLLVVCVAIAAGAAALAGVIASLSFRLPVRGIWRDALLGLLGFLVVVAAFAFFGPLRTFASSDEVPLEARLAAATAAPVLREFCRFIRSRRAAYGRHGQINPLNGPDNN